MSEQWVQYGNRKRGAASTLDVRRNLSAERANGRWDGRPGGPRDLEGKAGAGAAVWLSW